MKVINHTTLFRKYHGQWVVLDASRHRVLASGSSLAAALTQFRKRSTGQPPSVLKVPSELLPYVGSTG